MSRGFSKVGQAWITGIGLLVAFQMFAQWQLDLDVSLTPYEIAWSAALLVAIQIWIWRPDRRVARTSKPIAEDTTSWHFGRNAPILAIGVIALIVMLASLSIVLPELDPVIDRRINRFISVPLALLGFAGLASTRTESGDGSQL